VAPTLWRLKAATTTEGADDDDAASNMKRWTWTVERTWSEKLFAEFCTLNAIPCSRVARADDPTPDFVIELGSAQVTCELKQINPNAEDLQELCSAARSCPTPTGPPLPSSPRCCSTITAPTAGARSIAPSTA
jgi:hypothetical protein